MGCRQGTVALLALLAAAAPAPAHAAAGQESVFMDDDMLLYGGDAKADATLDELRALGTDRVRVSVHWRSLAPRGASPGDATDPAKYEAAVFDKFDHLVRSASARGIAVLFNVTGPAPSWAAGRAGKRFVNGHYRPAPRPFGMFVQMLGRRYSGTWTDENQGAGKLPRVTAWSIWNEPNQGAFLQPQWVRGRRGEWVAASPGIYRRLVRAAVTGLRRAGHGDETILLGETAPLGAKRRGRTRAMAPGLFLARLFCLDQRRHKPARGGDCDFRARGALGVSGFAHHPYSVTSPPTRSRADRHEFTLADTGRLQRLLDGAFLAHRVPRGLPIWFTEYGYQTRPPDPYRGVSTTEQARWLAEAELIAWRNPRVASHAQFLLHDDEPWLRYGPRDRRRWTTYQTGLRFENGTAKPAYFTYRMPLVVPPSVRAGAGMGVWGLVRPDAGEEPPVVRLEFAPAGSDAYEPVGEPIRASGPRQSFETRVTPRATGNWRIAWTPPAPAASGDGFGGVFSGPPPSQPETLHSAPVAVRVVSGRPRQAQG